MNSDNKFGKSNTCPARMSDARIFTNWWSSGKTNQYIMHLNNIADPNDYRMFLQKNAVQIMENEKSYLESHKKCKF